MKLSIIVPVYNVESFIRECITSLYSQSLSLSDFEVVIINDGSIDNSIKIVKEFQSVYNNIIIHNQKNSGLSVARNEGLRLSVGDYVLFVDSDDYLLSNTLSLLLEKAIRNDLDVLRAEYQNCDVNGVVLKKRINNKKRMLFADKIVDGNDLYEHLFCFEYYSPLLLMKRSFLVDNKLNFKVGVYFEDVDFALNLYKAAKRVMYIPLDFYMYRLRSGSITHSFNRKKIEDLVSLILNIVSILESDKQSIGLQMVMKEHLTRLCTFLFLRMAEYSLSDKDKNMLLFSLKDKIANLPMYGELQDRIIALLFNIFGYKVVYLLYLPIWLKLQWKKIK